MVDQSEDLLARAGNGDPAAFDVLLERHLPGLRLYVRRNISPTLLAKESSSDLVQSVCREVLQNARRFEYQGEAAFRSWLYQAALRKLIDRHRFYNAEKRDVAREAHLRGGDSLSGDDFARIASSIHSPSGDVMMREEVERLERGFAKLSEEDRRIVRLIYVEGLTHEQAARQLGCTEVASRKALSRALARLSKQLA